MKKVLSILLSLILTFFATSCVNVFGGGNKNGVDAPIFKEVENGLRFSAYASPPPVNWSGSTGNVEGLTDKTYSDMAAAGFNTVYALYEGQPIGSIKGNTYLEKVAYKSTFAEKHAVVALDLAEKYGLKYWVRDWTFYGLVRELAGLGVTERSQYEAVIDQMFSENNPYIKKSAYGGNFGHDEPSVEEMEKIVWQVELYQAKMKELGIEDAQIYLNLLPCYASQDHLSSKDKSITYEDYLDYYIEHLAPLVGYICYDYYPLQINSYNVTYVKNTYLYNLELVARKCKEYEKKTGKELELKTFLQATSDFTGIRPLRGVADLRFQIYTEMAFGSKEFIYYTYSCEDPAVDLSIYDYMKGETTWLYEAAKTANNEVLQMQDAYLAYKWDNVMFKNADPMYDNQAFAYLKGYLESHDKFEIKNCTQDVIVGTFKGRENPNEDAFMIVNYSDPGKDLDNDVTVKFNGAKAILMYRLGQRIIYPLGEDGEHTFSLLPGEGRFVIPLY